MAAITLDIRQASRLSALRARLQRLYDRGQWDHASECASDRGGLAAAVEIAAKDLELDR